MGLTLVSKRRTNINHHAMFVCLHVHLEDEKRRKKTDIHVLRFR